jgi:AraC-like DNA-binding protein
MESTLSNVLYLAIKFDKTREVTDEIQTYREAQKNYGISINVDEVLCNAIESCNAGNYDKAFEALQTPLTYSSYFNEKDILQIQGMVTIAQYSVLLKSGKRSEALKLLLQQEQFLRENEMPFELLEVLQLIKQHYEMEGNKALADKYALLYYTTKDEFINKSRVGRMDEAKINLELEETRVRIREMSYRQKMQSILLWSAIIITLLALGILAVLYVNYRKTKRTNRLLYEKNIALLNANNELRPVTENSERPTQEKLSQADLELLDKITAVMASSSEVFSDAFSLNRLAELVGSNSKYVSRAINLGKQCNFSVLLNEYRIKEACRRLMDTNTYGNFTIEGIANSLGYKSRSNFTTIFKESVGLTPSAFQKLSRDGEDHPDQSTDHPEE